MSDDPSKKPDDPELLRALIKVAQEAADEQAADSEWQEEIHITPEGKWGTPWPEGTKDDPPARWKLFGMRPASMLIQ